MSKKNTETQTGWQRFASGWKGFWTWVFRLRSVGLAIPVAVAAVGLAVYNEATLPALVGIDLQANGEYAQMIAREIAVLGPLALTALCLLFMFCSRRVVYPWLISIFSLVLPILILITNIFPA
ncbi:MAG: hypothetical protein IKU07_08130 [Oscillospiraceae bacterium]|nr:hypothetical protein [Oscillospiraceae bacterium]